MKKLIVLVFIILAGSLYFFSIEEKERKVLVKKDFNLSHGSSFFKNVPKEEKESKLGVIVCEIQELNTTIKTEISLKSKTHKYEKQYKYIWKENENIIGVGDEIKRKFSLGEHNLTCQLFDKISSSIITIESINVTAWKYIREEVYYFSISTDRYELDETKFFNHLKQLLLRVDKYSKKEFVYNEYGKIIEERYENFNIPKYNYTITNSYDGEKLLSMEKVDDEGKVLESHLYDEEGKEIVEELFNPKIQPQENDVVFNSTQKKPIKIYNKDGKLTYLASPNGKYIKKMKYEKGRLIYHETTYPKGKNIMNTRYNKKGQEIYHEYLRLNTEGDTKSREIINRAYDASGNLIKKERQYSNKGMLVQHILEQWHYKKGKKLSYEREALVGICPCTADIVKEKSTYVYDKNGTLLSSDYRYKKEGDTEFRKSKKSKTIKTYCNSLE